MSITDKPHAPGGDMSHNVEKHPVTRAYARGVATGAFVLTFFGAFWAFEAITNWPQTSSFVYVLLSLPVAALILFAVIRFFDVAKLPQAADGDRAARDGKRTGIAFGIIFAVEAILIAAAAVILGALGHPLFIPIAVALIVGLHLLPLARLFGVPLYYVTGLLCIACALASLLVPDEALRLLMLGLAIAMILWGSAGVVLLQHTGFNRQFSEA
jgi:hypothetical protein